MSKRRATKGISDEDYKRELHALHVELVKLQRTVIAEGLRVLLIFEGRDAAGKDGTIKRITRHMSPRETRVFAPAKPTERERESWYFQRFLPHLPANGEIVVFNRSWYNRAGVEPVMGFCSANDTERFLGEVLSLEHLLARGGVHVRKLYLDVSRKEQAKRLEERREDPLKQWKISPVDARAAELWDEYTAARDRMLRRTHDEALPWVVVSADHKRTARLNAIRHLLSTFEYEGRRDELLEADPDVVFRFAEERLDDGSIAP
jgi:polyphosphate kinase 2